MASSAIFNKQHYFVAQNPSATSVCRRGNTSDAPFRPMHVSMRWIPSRPFNRLRKLRKQIESVFDAAFYAAQHCFRVT